ncbi:MAG: transposase [Spirochaetota bacterium]|nr:transposase [Spirochaetota bacterium]
MARFISINRDQLMMLPISLDRFVDEEHLAKHIWTILSCLNLNSFEEIYQNADRGALAINPRNIIALLLYAYAKGVRSSRDIERYCKEDLAYIYLSEMQTPDHTTISTLLKEKSR